jgi:exodeoxyribonuclease VII large subunit
MAVYSVSQVITYLRDVLAQDPVLQDVWVRGEIANLARPGSGHSYFSLRDADTTLRCVMFRGARGAELLSNGGAIIAHGHIAVYVVRGDLQLIVDIVQPEGVGDLQLKLEQLKLKLEAEGLFEPSRKRPLPKFPSRVGVVTSPGGAVWQDIQTVIQRRYPLVELLLAPTAVQGDGAARGVVDAFNALDRMPDVDVVIVARGGGSLEDLWPFNEEIVARAIFASRTPVISAVGHETDTTVADLVADRRAPTASVAAEMAVPDRLELYSTLLTSQQSLAQDVSNQLRSVQDALAHLQPRLRRGHPDLDGLRIRVDDLLRSAARHLGHDIEVKLEHMGGLTMRLESLSPRDTLRRGYAIVRTQADAPVVLTDSAQVSAGDSVQVTLARGGFGAEVKSTQGDGDGAEASDR